MADLVIKEGDTAPALRATFVHQNGMPVNLAGATVTVTIRSQASGPVLVAAAPAAIVGLPADGTVEYEWQTGDTDTPGLYNAEWEVTWASGDTQTFPSDGYTVIEISADLVSAVPVLPDLPDYCWPIDSGCCLELETYPAEVQARAIALATQTLRMLTGYRVGGCPITVRPCKAGCNTYGMLSYWNAGTVGNFYPHMIEGGVWVNSCPCVTDCSCGAICEVTLPAPVGEVYEVVVDGTIQDPATYRVDGNRLVWVGDGDCPWPTCQDLTKPDTEVGTFSVTYLNSYPVDAWGAHAAGVLAMEYAKACTGSKACRLPGNVTAVTRQGVSFELVAGSFPGGYTGIREIDAFIATWNPTPIRQQSQVWSPDLHQPRVVR